LRYKESKGKLALKFVSDNGGLVVEITDDGIGRKRSTELKTENQKKQHSTGLKNIQERLRIINKVYRVNCHVSISDIGENTGTRVLLHLPIRQAV
jgi:two-component system LytT family sensor kinase